MATLKLEPTLLAGTSAEITVAAGSTNTVAIYQGKATLGSNFKLPNGIDDFLLPGGTDFLLLPLANQGSIKLGKKDWGDIQLKNPEGTYESSGLTLRHNARFKTLGPGVWVIVKPATPTEFGFQSE
jgi:hypothetical protein